MHPKWTTAADLYYTALRWMLDEWGRWKSIIIDIVGCMHDQADTCGIGDNFSCKRCHRWTYSLLVNAIYNVPFQTSNAPNEGWIRQLLRFSNFASQCIQKAINCLTKKKNYQLSWYVEQMNELDPVAFLNSKDLFEYLDSKFYKLCRFDQDDQLNQTELGLFL